MVRRLAGYGPRMARPHIEHLHTPQVDWQPLDWPGWPAGAGVKLLSRDEQSGALSALVSLPAGWTRPAGHVVAGTDIVVVAGELCVGDDVLPRLGFEWSPAGGTQEPWTAGADAGAELLVLARTGPPDLLPGPGPAGGEGRIRLHPDELDWVGSRFANGPVGTASAMYRSVPGGEMTLMVRFQPSLTRSQLFEFHDCVEECYLLEGHIDIGNHLTEGGDMHAGTYFWRPPFITHGDTLKREGGLLYVYTDGPLVNFLTTGFERTPEENRRQAEAGIRVHPDAPPRPAG